MSAKKNKIFAYALLIYTAMAVSNQQVITFISPRSQSFNLERMMVGWENSIHQPGYKDRFYGTWSFTIEATSSFRAERINQCLFGEEIVTCPANNTEWTDFITVSGSQTSNRIPQKDWLADYFGLPPDFKSLVKFRPRVNNFIFDNQAFFGLNTLLPGLYMRFALPIVYANWDLNMRECIQDGGSRDYNPGYFNDAGVQRVNLMPSFSSFVAGFDAPHTENLIFQPLKKAKMPYRSQRLVQCSELIAVLGYDHFMGNYHHMGIGFQAAAPCGNTPKGIYLFEPIIGNGHHWECGAEVSAHFRTWTHETENIFTELFFYATVTHLFKNKQYRSFDLCQNPNSRYMLAEKLTPSVTNNLNGAGTPVIAQYDYEVSPIANLTTLPVDVSISAQADIAFMYSYTKHSTTWSIGYSFWKRGCELIRLNACTVFPEKIWALKGDSSAVGFIAQNNLDGLPVGSAVALSATESKATIHGGTNFKATGISNDPVQQKEQIAFAQRNPGIDKPQKAFAGNNQFLVSSLSDASVNNQINTSVQPLFLSMDDIDLHSGATSGFSQKFFAHFNHKVGKPNEKNRQGYIGLGAEVEFGRQAGPTPDVGDDRCINCALSLWGMWAKMGIDF